MVSERSRGLRRSGRGFTLVELLVVVLILAILMAVALPLYLSTIADSQKKTCRANMQTIANAVQAARVKANAPDYSAYVGDVITLVGAGKLPDLNAAPICPGTGTYAIVGGGTSLNDANGNAVTVPTGSFGVQCSITAHGGFIPGSMGN